MSIHHYGTLALSKREQEVVVLVAEGLKNREVADRLGTTEAVIKNYLRRIYDKVGVWSRVELALWYEARRHANLHAEGAAKQVSAPKTPARQQKETPQLRVSSTKASRQKSSQQNSLVTIADKNIGARPGIKSA